MQHIVELAAPPIALLLLFAVGLEPTPETCGARGTGRHGRRRRTFAAAPGSQRDFLRFAAIYAIVEMPLVTAAALLTRLR